MKHTLVFHVISLAKKLQKVIGFKAPPLSLSYSQASTLLLVDGYKNINQRELAQRLHLEPASVVSLIDELVKLKLVKRQSPDDDRRKYHIILTENGKVKVKQIKSRTYQLDNLLKSQLSPNEVRTLSTAIEKLSTYLADRKGGEYEIFGTKRSLAA